MPEETATKKKRTFLSRLLPNSTAGRVALVTGILLVVAVITIWIALSLGAFNVPVAHFLGPWVILIEICLAMLVIPALVYWVLRPSQAVTASHFPDIDRAWESGLEALKGVGLSLDDIPLVMVLGSNDSSFEQSLMRASLLDFRVDGEPRGAHVNFAMHWYVTTQAVYLFCTDASATSEVVRQWIKSPGQRRASGEQVPTGLGIEADHSGPQLREYQPAPSRPAAVASSARPGGTISFEDGASLAPASAVAVETGPRPTKDDSDDMGPPAAALTPSSSTISSIAEDVGSDATPGELRNQRGSLPADAPPAVSRGRAAVAEVDTSMSTRRLEYLCHLIRHARRPLCGINGVVALLPFEISFARERSLAHLAESIGRDLETIHETLQLRAPVTAIVTGLDCEKGFGEFVSRLDPSYRTRRLGGRFNLRSRPTPNQLNDHSDGLCDAFEDWIYQLFREPNALANQRANRKLYGFLNRIRHGLKPNLRLVVGRAFGCEEGPASQQLDEDESSAFFSGCYFASLGGYGGPPAFVRDILGDKLLREQACVQWNKTALRIMSLRRAVGLSGWIALVLLSVALVAQLLWRWMGA